MTTADDKETTVRRSTYRQATHNQHAVSPGTHFIGGWVGHLQGKNSFTLKMETAISSEILVPIYRPTLHDISEDSNLHSHRCENLQSHIRFGFMLHSPCQLPSPGLSSHCSLPSCELLQAS
jgi:hypothetical protein